MLKKQTMKSLNKNPPPCKEAGDFLLKHLLLDLGIYDALSVFVF